MFIKISKFLQDSEDYVSNVVTLEKFIPTIKNIKNNCDEGKEKIIKKIKESLDKLKINYTDSSLIEILIPSEVASKLL